MEAGHAFSARRSWVQPLWPRGRRTNYAKAKTKLARHEHHQLTGAILEYIPYFRLAAFKPKSHTPESETDRAAANSDWLETLVTQKRQERLHDFLGRRSGPLELLCGCDQVGTLKILTDASGNIVKEIVRDSFGVQQSDSFPGLFMPVGFAGGMARCRRTRGPRYRPCALWLARL